MNNFSAGEIQGHIIRNAFNVLANKGFLRDQGILSLESVQKFYKIIEEEPKSATLRVANVLDFCNQFGHHELDYQPVITLTRKNFLTGHVQGHAVVLFDYRRREDSVVMTAIDSLSETGKTFIECPIVHDDGKQRLKIRGSEDEWCLGSEICYVFYLR